MKAIVDATLGRITRKNGEARRVWLQGAMLSANQWTEGSKYDVEINNSDTSITLRLSDDGLNTVSRKKKRNSDETIPVIDVRRTELNDLFGETTDKVRVEIDQGVIKVTLTPVESSKRNRIERITAKIASGETLRVGDLGHGAGILLHSVSEGIKSVLGVDSKIAFAVEIDSDAINTSIANNPLWDNQSVALNMSMEDVDYSSLGKAEIVVAGLPCVAHSQARRNKKDVELPEQDFNVGGLFMSLIEAVAKTEPAVVLLENVVAYEKSISLDLIRNRLTKLGYDVHIRTVDNSLGALEKRQRMAMVATTKGLEFNFDDIKPSRQVESSLREVLDDVPDDDSSWKDSAVFLAKQERGQKDGSVFKANIIEGDETSISTIGAGYAKSRMTEPHLRNASNPNKIRLLTVNEHSRVKSIPEFLVKGVSKTLGHQLLGNSVLAASFKSVGMVIGESLNKHTNLQPNY